MVAAANAVHVARLGEAPWRPQGKVPVAAVDTVSARGETRSVHAATSSELAQGGAPTMEDELESTIG